MDRDEEFLEVEFKSFPPRRMLDYYCPKRLADYNARQQASRPHSQPAIQGPVDITVDKDIAVIAVGDNISVFKTEHFSQAQAAVFRGEAGNTIDFVSARILLLQLSHAAGV